LSTILVRNQTIMKALVSILVKNGFKNELLSEPYQHTSERFSFKYEYRDLFDVKILRAYSLSDTVELVFEFPGEINLDKYFAIFDDLEKRFKGLKFTFTI
jgi:hypothetical protein